MNFYNLTKSEYKEKLCEFRKTYIGRNLLIKMIITFMLFVVITIMSAFEFNNLINHIGDITLCYLIVLSSLIVVSGIAFLISSRDFDRSLKEYIEKIS